MIDIKYICGKFQLYFGFYKALFNTYTNEKLQFFFLLEDTHLKWRKNETEKERDSRGENLICCHNKNHYSGYRYIENLISKSSIARIQP